MNIDCTVDYDATSVTQQYYGMKLGCGEGVFLIRLFILKGT